MIPARLSVATIGAHDPATLRSFYESLGWEPVHTDDDFALFLLGGAHLGVYRLSLLTEEAAATAPPAAGAFKGVTLAINVAEREQVDAAIEMAREAGASVLAEPTDQEWGGRSGYFADPEGNAWEVAWVPGSSFDESGALIWPSS